MDDKFDTMIPEKLKYNRKVTFNPEIKVLTMHVWSFAYAQARTHNWLQISADRCRFERRIKDTSEILTPILTDDYRKRIADRIKL